jgi:FlaA1/EpsC-like NDP-sugar epimerase
MSKRVSTVFRAQLQERNPFLRGLVTWIGFKTVYVPFTPARRAEGKSNYSASALLSFAINGICSFSKAPLRFAIAVGLIVAALSLVGGIVQILVYMLSDTTVPGWPTLIVLITFVAGLQLFFMGVVGEYIGLIFDEVKSRPRYLVDQSIEYGKQAEQAAASGSATGTPYVRAAALEEVVTRRENSLFATDVEANRERIASAFAGRRLMVVGGGGSIGAATIELLLGYEPAAVHVVDHSENYLAELVRSLRGQDRIGAGVDFQALPLDYGGSAMARLLRDAKPYDIVLNFAAVKHVRSEKDVYSVLQMLDTNIVRHIRFKKWLAENGHGGGYFAVSTDKAANPVNLMGASKRLMEDLIFEFGADSSLRTTAARFANVAFSNGSLLAGFAQRIAKRQPIAVPRDTRRYFISHREAGEICVLAATLVPDRHLAIPKLDPASELQSLEAIAVRVLETYGLGAVAFEDEAEARAAVAPLAAQGRWPLLRTALDTSGEKPFEEFVGQGEAAAECGLKTLLAIRHTPSRAVDRGLFGHLEQLIGEPDSKTSKAEIVEAMAAALSNFQHRETGRSLDQRL